MNEWKLTIHFFLTEFRFLKETPIIGIQGKGVKNEENPRYVGGTQM